MNKLNCFFKWHWQIIFCILYLFLFLYHQQFNVKPLTDFCIKISQYISKTIGKLRSFTKSLPLILNFIQLFYNFFIKTLIFLVIKQRMQMPNSPYRSVLSCMRHVYATEGIAAFYRSYRTSLLMNVPFQSIHFVTYEFTQSISNPQRIYNPTAHVVSGMFLKD